MCSRCDFGRLFLMIRSPKFIGLCEVFIELVICYRVSSVIWISEMSLRYSVSRKERVERLSHVWRPIISLRFSLIYHQCQIHSEGLSGWPSLSSLRERVIGEGWAISRSLRVGTYDSISLGQEFIPSNSKRVDCSPQRTRVQHLRERYTISNLPLPCLSRM